MDWLDWVLLASFVAAVRVFRGVEQHNANCDRRDWELHRETRGRV